MHPRTRKLGLWLTIITVLTLTLSFASDSAAANGKDGFVPPINLSVQGRLTDAAGAPITTATNITFSIYPAPDSINPIYTESASITPDASGLYTYLLGTNNTIDQSIIAQFSHQLYLGVKVGADSEMTPRFALSASPYALSLAPGAVADGVHSGTTNQYGTINGINQLTNSSDNAGLYGKGATGVRGKAQSSGNTGGYGGYFSNAGGGTGTHYGVYGQNSSNGGTTGYGGFFENLGGGSGSQSGIRANNTSTGGTSGYAGYFQNVGGGYGRQFGIVATSPGYGIFGQSSAANSQQESAGVVGNSTVAGGYGGIFTGTIGVQAVSNPTGGQAGNAAYFANNGGTNAAQNGVQAYNTSTGGTYGTAGFFRNYGGGNNRQIGIKAENASTGGTTGYAGYFDNSGGGSGTQYGIYSTSPGYGLYALSTNYTGQQNSVGLAGRSSTTNGYGGAFTGTNGMAAYASGSGNTAGTAGYFLNSGGGNAYQYGIYVNNIVTTANDSTAGWFSSFDHSGQDNSQSAVYAKVSDDDAGTSYAGSFSNYAGALNNRYGIYVSSSTNNTSNLGYSGYFDSDSTTRTAVYVKGAMDVTGSCCLSSAYTVKVWYHGTATLPLGSPLAADGDNPTLEDGEQVLGATLADKQNADAILGLASYPLKEFKDERGHSSWQLNTQAHEIKPGDLVSVVFAGQAQVKLDGRYPIGSKLTLVVHAAMAICSPPALPR